MRCAGEPRESATRSRPRRRSSGPAERRSGFSFAATRTSRLRTSARWGGSRRCEGGGCGAPGGGAPHSSGGARSEEHTSELQSHSDLVCRLLLEKKKKN